jgi:ferredoxin/flavodoxin---NADP+ reductase
MARILGTRILGWGTCMTPEEISRLKREHYNAQVVYLRKKNPDLMILRVKTDFPRPIHKPGQYSTLGLGFWEPRHPGCQPESLTDAEEGQLARRAYSLSCSVLDEEGKLLDLDRTDWLEFYIVLVRESDREKPPALTPRLFMLREGDRLSVGRKIAGNFTADPIKPDDSVVLLSTGTGEAPHNYLTWQLLRQGHRGKILSACCVRFKRDLGYLDIQEKLMKQHPNYKYLSLTTREKDTIGHKVYIQDLISSGQLAHELGAKLDPAKTHVYLCGNPKMIGVPGRNRETGARTFPEPLGVVEILDGLGFQQDDPANKIKGNIHVEEYW